jgi:hypothetical protein
MHEFSVVNDTLFVLHNEIKDIHIPLHVHFLSPRCFENCIQLRTVILPEGIIELPIACFMGCSSIIKITLPSSLRRIEEDSFSQSSKGVSGSFSFCNQLSQVNIPEGVTENPLLFLLSMHIIKIYFPSFFSQPDKYI